MQRYAAVAGPRKTIEAYLPANYRVIGEVDSPLGEPLPGHYVVIQGEDNAGWTLDDYVIPRLASGLYFALEIDLSHPLMKLIP